MAQKSKLLLFIRDQYCPLAVMAPHWWQKRYNKKMKLEFCIFTAKRNWKTFKMGEILKRVANSVCVWVRERTNLSLLRADLYNHSKVPKNNNNGIEGIFLLFKRFGSFSNQGACEGFSLFGHRLMKRFFLTHNWVPIEARLSNAEQKPSRIVFSVSFFQIVSEKPRS